MKTATERLIELAERLNPTGLIGDGMVAEFHSLAARVRREQGLRPVCYGSDPNPEQFALNDCGSCVHAHPCLDI